MSREDGDRSSERYPLVNLGLCYWALGQTLRAVDFLEQAQAIMREVGDRYGEGLALVNLGLCYSDLGRMARAIDYLEQALAIAREVGQRVAEGIDLENLAWCHWTLGQTARAIEYAEQALAVAREVGDRRVEGYALYTLARLSIDEGRPDDAICQAIEAVRLGEETGDPMIISVGDENLALAHLCIGDLPAARAAAEAARKQDIAMNNHNVLSLSGLIALRQGDRNAAVESYSAAIAQAEMMLDCCNQNYHALDAKGLALAGLAVLEGGNRAAEAIATFQAARAITSARRDRRPRAAVARRPGAGRCGRHVDSHLPGRRGARGLSGIGLVIGEQPLHRHDDLNRETRHRAQGLRRGRRCRGLGRFAPTRISCLALREQPIRPDLDAGSLTIERDVEVAKEPNLTEGDGNRLLTVRFRCLIRECDLRDDPSVRRLSLPQFEADILTLEALRLLTPSTSESRRLTRIDRKAQASSHVHRYRRFIGPRIHQTEQPARPSGSEDSHRNDGAPELRMRMGRAGNDLKRAERKPHRLSPPGATSKIASCSPAADAAASASSMVLPEPMMRRPSDDQVTQRPANSMGMG